MCTCGHGSPIGGNCLGDGDCVLDGCPPNNQVTCDIGQCTCVPSWYSGLQSLENSRCMYLII